MKRFFQIAAVISACLLWTASARAANDYVLGYLTASTGPFVSLSRANQIAAQIAVDQINAKGGIEGHKLRLVLYDTSGKPEESVAGATKLAEDNKVLAIIGPFSSGEAKSTFPVGDRLGICTMSMASSAPKLAAPFKFAFRNTSDEGYMFTRVMKTIVAKNIPHATAYAAYATDDTISKIMGTKVLPGVLKQFGVNVKGEVSFNLAAFDLSPQATTLTQNQTDLVAIGSPPEAAIKLVAEMRRLGAKARAVAGSTIADPDLPEKMGKGGNGTIIPTTFYADLNARTKAFAAEFRKRTKAQNYERTEASQFDAATYDIVRFYAWAIEKAGVTGAPDKLAQERIAIRDALRGMKNYPALEGAISFGSDGDALKPVYVLEAENGKWTLLAQYPAQ